MSLRISSFSDYYQNGGHWLNRIVILSISGPQVLSYAVGGTTRMTSVKEAVIRLAASGNLAENVVEKCNLGPT